MSDEPEIPENWHWGVGNRGASYYTHWLYTDRVDDGYEAEVYWDKGGDGTHKVVFYEILGVKEDGDPDVCEYPCHTSHHDSEAEALQAAAEHAHEIEA